MKSLIAVFPNQTHSSSTTQQHTAETLEKFPSNRGPRHEKNHVLCLLIRYTTYPMSTATEPGGSFDGVLADGRHITTARTTLMILKTTSLSKTPYIECCWNYCEVCWCTTTTIETTSNPNHSIPVQRFISLPEE